MIPKKIPGIIGKATISKGFTMHVPDAVVKHFALEVGDKLEFYNPLTDLPDDLTLNFELIAVVVKRKNPTKAKPVKEGEKGGARNPPMPFGMPADGKTHKLIYDRKTGKLIGDEIVRG